MVVKDGLVTELRAKIEQLALLEMVAESRQQQLEELLDTALGAGLDPEAIRDELELSEESMDRLRDRLTPDLHERLGISRTSAERLRKNATSST